MSRIGGLRDHLLNREFHDDADNLILRGNPSRLTVSYSESPGNWQTIVQSIMTTAEWPLVWFPDSNVAIRDDTSSVWNAFRLASLQRGDASCLLSACVHSELSEWLVTPRHHANRAREIQSAIEQDSSWIRRLSLSSASSEYAAILGYLRLIGFRRYLARPWSHGGPTLVGTDATDKSRTMNAIRDQVGERAVGIAKKGRIDIEKRQAPNLNDEMHCLTAVAHAIRSGQNVVILTSDEDLIEVFWKVQWFIDTHYRAWHVAKLIADGKYGSSTGFLENTRGFFEGPITLYRRRTNQLRDVLPSFFRTVTVVVWYVSPKSRVTKLGFAFEREMQGMLETRSRTKGRCTDLLGHSNVHVDLGPLKDDLKDPSVGVGRDVAYSVQTNDVTVELSRLDVEHALNCRERIAIRG